MRPLDTFAPPSVSVARCVFPHRLAMAVLLCIAAALLTGCHVQDHLTINADGSGSVQIETRWMGPHEQILTWRHQGGGEAPHLMYPPKTEQEALALFPGDDFEVQVKTDTADGEPVTRVTATFQDVNALLKSPYARAHSLTLAIDPKDSGRLVLRARTGIEGIGTFESVSDEDLAQSGLSLDADERKQLIEKTGFVFKVTLPGDAKVNAKADFITIDGRTVTWSHARSKTDNAAQFSDQLSRVMSASCPATGVTFKPVTPPRLALDAFAELRSAQYGETGDPVDAASVRKAARFVPLIAKVTRTFNLTGQNRIGENRAMLIGAVVVPMKYKPLRWGKPKFTHVTAAGGANLLQKVDEGRFARRFGVGDFGWGMDEESQDKAEDVAKIVQVPMKVPPPEVTSIASVKGSIAMHFGGALHVLKVKDAIKTVADQAAGFGVGFSERAPLNDAALKDLGVTIQVMGAARQRGFTMLMLQMGEDGAVVKDIQVFDKDGKVWPTLYVKQNTHAQVLVLGQPQPPLSLALLASGGGPRVELPIELTNVPLTPNKPPAEPEQEQSEP